jgi:hypothetical protein
MRILVSRCAMSAFDPKRTFLVSRADASFWTHVLIPSSAKGGEGILDPGPISIIERVGTTSEPRCRPRKPMEQSQMSITAKLALASILALGFAAPVQAQNPR